MWMITVTFYKANDKYISMSEYIKQSLHTADDTLVVLSAHSHTKGEQNILIPPAAIWIVAVKVIEMCLISVVCFILFSDTFTKLQKATISLVSSVCPHGTTRLPLLHEFS